MNHSSKPQQSFHLGADHLHGVLRVDQIRTDTLVQLVQHWADPQSRDDIIDALNELADVVAGVAREGELDAAVEQVEDVAGMDTAQIEVGPHDVRRLLAELAEVERRTSRFLQRGGSLIKHPTHPATRPVPAQQDRRTA
jgi:basic membrane lipoprotein Med (substrate-binding protein (PBP1-ABC) superfamily)